MKKFLKYLFLFSVPLLAAAVFFEIYLRQIDTTYTEKEKGIIQNHDKIELLIVGNSRANFGIDPNQFDVYAYNLANVAQTIYYDKRITLKHLKTLKNLKYVFIILDISSLYESRMDSRAVWSYYGNDVEYEDELPLLSKMSYLKGYSPSIAVQLLKNDLGGKYKTIKALDLDPDYKLDMPIVRGFCTYKGTNESGMSKAHIANRAANGKDKGISSEKPEILSDLDEFIMMLKARKVTPILLTMPCYGDYIKALNKTALSRSRTDYSHLAQRRGLEYWDYLEYPMQRSDFHDCDHFNYNGAVKFSKVLNQRLNATIAAKIKKPSE